MLDIISKGGPIMYVLFLCSFWGLYIIIQKLLFLKFNSIDQALLIEKIKNKLITIGKDQTLKDLRTERGIIPRVLVCAIKLSPLQRDEIQEGLKEATYIEIPKLEKNMNILSSIIAAAPLLGLLGTVIGLINIFNVISGGGIGNTEQLSAGIAQALITTVTGLTIAIPFIFFYQYLSHCIELFIMDMERLMNELLNFCKINEGVKP